MEWTGEGPLHPDLIRFYAEIGPWGDEDAAEPSGLWIPSHGNEYRLPSLSHLWDFQAGYRWNGNDNGRLPDWPNEWLVVAEQGGDPFILHRGNGTILHAHHGNATWHAVSLFPDVFAMAATLGTIGAVQDEAGVDLLDEECVLWPAWQAALRAEVEAYAAAACLTRQEQPFLRDQGHFWAAGILERAGGWLDHWRALGDAVAAEATRRPMPVARGDGPVQDSAKPLPLIFCHELVRGPAVRAAIGRQLPRPLSARAP